MTTPTHVLNGLDRSIQFGPWPKVRGGQIWTQTAFPCFSDFTVFLGRDKWVLVPNPIREQGNIALQWRGPWEIYFTSEQLQTYFHQHRFHCEGQCHDLIWNRDRLRPRDGAEHPVMQPEDPYAE